MMMMMMMMMMMLIMFVIDSCILHHIFNVSQILTQLGKNRENLLPPGLAQVGFPRSKSAQTDCSSLAAASAACFARSRRISRG